MSGTYSGAGAKVSSVSHINSYADEDPGPDAKEAPDLIELLSKLAVAEGKEAEKVSGFVRNPKLIKEEAVALQRQLDRMRVSLDGAARVAQAEALKAAANTQFSAGKSRAALIGYLAGIWFLRPGPNCPMLVAHALVSEEPHGDDFKRLLAEAADSLGAGAGTSEADAEAPGGTEGAAVRTSLHLNLAAAALKLSEWATAKAACKFVLSLVCRTLDPPTRAAARRIQWLTIRMRAGRQAWQGAVQARQSPRGRGRAGARRRGRDHSDQARAAEPRRARTARCAEEATGGAEGHVQGAL